MLIAGLLRIVYEDGALFVIFRWKGLLVSDGTTDTLTSVYEDVTNLTRKLVERKSTPAALRTRAHAALSL